MEPEPSPRLIFSQIGVDNMGKGDWRKSSYIIKIKLENEDRYLLVHGYTGAVDLVDAAIIEFLDKFQGVDRVRIKKSSIDMLKRRGYLTLLSHEEERDRVRVMAEIIRKFRRPLSFVFIVTYECNFNCPYCYERDLLTGDSKWVGKVMSHEYVNAVFNAVDGLGQNSDPPPSIGLYGGEPFLAKNFDVVDYIVMKAMSRGSVLSAVTNGYEMDRFISVLGRGKIESVQITLDGPPNIHDSRRYLSDGGGTFNKIAENINSALAVGARVHIRVNVDGSNFLNLLDLYSYFEEAGWFRFKNFSSYIADVRLGKEYFLQFPMSSWDIINLLDRKRAESSSWSKVKYNNYMGIKSMFKRVFKDGGYVDYKSYYCGGNFGMYLFDPFGEVFVCWELIGSKYWSVGRYFPSLEIDKERLELWHGRTISAMKDCVNCRYALFCGGGCQHKAYVNKGDFFSSYCDSFPGRFNRFVSEAYSEYTVKTETAERR